MQDIISICCTIQCPIGKHCCFGEVYRDSLGDKPLRERHKCQYNKSTGIQYVDTETTKNE